MPFSDDDDLDTDLTAWQRDTTTTAPTSEPASVWLHQMTRAAPSHNSRDVTAPTDRKDDALDA